jgi:GTPase SAR1 family protein
LIDAHGFIFLYSITDKDSFNQLSELINQVKTSRKDDPGIIIVGTKSDLISLRQVSSFEGQQLARSNNCPYFEVSAKENDCVNEVRISNLLIRSFPTDKLFCLLKRLIKKNFGFLLYPNKQTNSRI